MRTVQRGTVLVANELLAADRPSIRCHASEALGGELRRRGLRTVSGPMYLIDDAAPGPRHDLGCVTVMPGSDGHVGLGVSVAANDRASQVIAAAAVADWFSVARPRTVLLASPRSSCAGVDRAVDTVERLLAQRDGPIYVRKEIVHNVHVLADLRARGAVFVDELDGVPRGATVVFSAHGVSPAVREQAARRELDIIDATCPLVAKVHAEARRFARRGDVIILIGHEGHEEVDGTLGEAPDSTALVETVDDVGRLHVEDPTAVSYLTQTTLGTDETAEIVTALRSRFPTLRGSSATDICYATTNRQQALKAVASEVDLTLVVGSANSSNAQRLVELAARAGSPAHLIDDASDIRPTWLADAAVIAVTAGASSPEHLVHAVVRAISGLGPVTIEERPVGQETVHFTLPGTVRHP